MTIKEWKDAGLAYEVLQDGVYAMPKFDTECKYMFYCSDANKTELPEDVKLGSIALVFDGDALSETFMLVKDVDGVKWNSLG